MSDQIRPEDERNVKEDSRFRGGVSHTADMAAGMPMQAGKRLEPDEIRPVVALSMTIDEALIVAEVLQERVRQRRRWGQAHDRRHTPAEWSALLAEQVGKFAQSATRIIPDFPGDYHPAHPDQDALERQAYVIMAVALAALEAGFENTRRARR